MREIISLHIGQAGIQLGSNIWGLYCLEHGIKPNGDWDADLQQQQLCYSNKSQNMSKEQEFESFFSQSVQEKYMARSIFIDLEPSAIDGVSTSDYRHIFQTDNLISGKQDANTYASGYYTIGREIVDIALDKIRKQVEKCINFQGFQVFHSVGGGTGSGLGSLLLEKLSQEYVKKTKMSYSIYPSSHLSNSVVEPYNSVFATHKLLDHTDTTVVLDNEAIYGLCYKNLDIDRPRFQNLNSLVAQAISDQTINMRVEASLNTSLDEITTNLVPYPRVHFLVNSMAPIRQNQAVPMQLQTVNEDSITELTEQSFEKTNFFQNCDPTKGKYMSVSLSYRGNIVPKDICPGICKIKTKKTIQFVDWCPTGFKCGINYSPTVVFPGDDLGIRKKSVSMMANSTSISQIFEKQTQNFNKMFKKKAYLHFYLREGMEEGEIAEAIEDIQILQNDYNEVQVETVEENNGEEY